MDERLLSPKDLAKRYGLTTAWVYRCADLRKLSFKVGKYLRWRESDIIALEEYRGTIAKRGFDLKHKSEVIRLLSNTTEESRKRVKLLFDIL
jgi:predicted DNA-binding transcriptional regulator AlpA